MTTADPRPTGVHRVMPYIRIMRVDHWFKNVFVLPGRIIRSNTITVS